MSKLLRSHFMRLRKSKVFWLGMILMLGIAIFVAINQYLTSLSYDIEVKPDSFILGFTIIIPVFAAVFSSLFLGAEYSDGTMRNKLVVGHSRTAVYLSALVANTVAALLMCSAFLLGACAVGIPLLGGVKIALPHLVVMLLGCIALVCAFCAILTAIAMLIPNKTIIAITSILGMVALLLLAISIDSRLQEPEFYSNVAFMVDGEIQSPDEPTPNPAYLTGVKRQVYEYAYDILPTGQALQYSSMKAEHLWQMPLYSLAIILLSTGFGVIAFRRKDFK